MNDGGGTKPMTQAEEHWRMSFIAADEERFALARYVRDLLSGKKVNREHASSLSQFVLDEYSKKHK